MRSFSFICFLFCFSIILQSQSYDVKKLGIENGLSNNYVVSITQDKKGFLWFATEVGLNRFDGRKFKVYKKNNNNGGLSISGNELNKVYADKYDDIVWIATQREGLNMFDCKTETFIHFKHDEKDSLSIITNDITDIVNAKDGNLWLSTYHNGVEYYDKKTGKFTHFNQQTVAGFPSNNVWSVKEDQNGHLFIGHLSAGLTIYSPKEKKVKNFRHNSSDPNSLPGNEVRAICFDENNNIWIGTNNGLALFDREKESFKVFRNDENNQSSLISNYIFAIEQTSDGKLWICTENGGVSILDIRKNMFLTPLNVSFDNISYSDDSRGLSNHTVRSVLQDSYDNIWITTYGGGINFISHFPKVFQSWSYSPIQTRSYVLSHKIAWGITCDKYNRMWIGTDGGGINAFSEGERIMTINKDNSTLSDDAILTAICDFKNNLWFGTFKGGVNIYDPQKNQITEHLLGQKNIDIRHLYEDKQGNMWIATSDGLYKYRISTKECQHYTESNSALSGKLVRSIFVDHQGFIWLGFFGNGLSIYDEDFNLVKNYESQRGFPSNTVDYIYGDRENRIWIATGEGLVLFESDKKGTDDYLVFNENNGYLNTHVRAITEDEIGEIWISSNDGISRLNPESYKFYNYDHRDGIPLGEFLSGSVSKDKDGLIYFGSQNGVCFFDPTKIVDSITLPMPVITDFLVYSDKTNIGNKDINLPVSSEVELSHVENSFNISFNTLDYALNKIVDYSYMLEGLDNVWYETQGEDFVKFRNIPYGKYKLLIKSRVKNQNWSDNMTSMNITIAPPLWLTWWAKIVYVILIVTIILFVIRFYKRKLELESSLILEKKNNQQKQNLNEERLRFFTNITHELRTPLTLILGPLEDLQNDIEIPAKQAAKISLIYRSATRLLSLINQILEFRKTETQNRKLAVIKGDIAQLVHEIGLKYKELNTNKRIEINIDLEYENLNIYYDADVVTIVLENLLSNSLKYTQQGTINLVLRQIVDNEIDYVEIEVNDTGKGISKDSITKIFDRYYQADIDSKVSGTGIGLALIKNLVELHQGEVFVDSKLGEGSSFRFRLKVDNVYPNTLHLDDKKIRQENEKSLENRLDVNSKEGQVVLVVEDDIDILEYIQSSLSSQYQVYTAVNGKDGLEKAYAHIPDIVISDIMMPEMDGLEMSKILKQDVRTSHIPIVLLTAKDSIQDRREGYDIGVDSYLTKPFSASLLQSRIVNLLEQRRRLAEQVNLHTIDKKNTIVMASLNKLDEEFIEKVTSIIESNLDSEKLDVVFIADRVNMSHSTLYRKIKALSGVSVNEFIRKVRLKNAEKLLLTRKYNISEITYMVGFNSQTYFRQCFKEEFGTIPSEYIKNILEGK